MFESLSNRLGAALDRLKRRGALTEADVAEALREIRVALLEADVALPAVKQLVAAIKEKAVGQEVLRSITPGQMVVKIVHDHLVEALGGTAEPLDLRQGPPTVILMVGLQGSGKTTTTAKIAKRLTARERKKVLMASLDVRRPAAQEQLAVLGRQIEVATLPIVQGQPPIAIAERAVKTARAEGYDVLLLDSAGRLSIDDELMAEIAEVKRRAEPGETLLVADAMTGQDAVTTARLFHEKVGVSGIVLTRIDGDSRGGAALSMRAVTGQPIKLAGVGEKLDQLEDFHPERIAGRILGMGDIVSLVEKAAEQIDQEQAAKMAAKLQAGAFDLEDFRDQLKQMLKMGGMGGLMGLMPGVGKLKQAMAAANVDDKAIRRQIAIVNAMTPGERRNPKILGAKRKIRVANGSGVQVQDVNRLLKQFLDMQKIMKQFGGKGGGGKLQRMLGMLGGGGGGGMPDLSQLKLPPGFPPPGGPPFGRK